MKTTNMTDLLKSERSAANLNGYFDGASDTRKDYEKAQKRTNKAVRRLEAENDRLRAFVDDLAAHGLRFDLNPTVDMSAGATPYIAYINRIDVSIRERAGALRLGSGNE